MTRTRPKPCFVVRLARWLTARRLDQRPMLAAALLLAAWLAPWREPAPKPIAIGPAPAVTAGMLERMQ